MKKNDFDIKERRKDIFRSYIERGAKPMKEFVIEQSERFRLSKATIWNDIKYFREHKYEFKPIHDGTGNIYCLY